MILKPRPFRKPNLGLPISRGIVGLWLFNEGSGGQVFDLSGNENTGLFGAGATSPIWAPGKFGSAISFDGGDYVEINDTYYDSGTHTQITVSIWCYSTGFILNEVTIARNNLKPFAIQITSVSGGNANFKTSVQTDGTGYIQSTTTGYPLLANQWNNVVLRYDGTTCKAFLNGQQVATKNGTGNLSTDAACNIYIGSYRTNLYFFTGLLDLPIIYNRALSASEIALLYREPFCMFERDPIELWSAATLGVAPPTGMAGAMTTNTGYWGW